MGSYSEHSGPCQGPFAARCGLALLLLLLPIFAAAEPAGKSGGQSRAAALAALAETRGFSLSGAERLGDASAPVMEDDLALGQRLRLLLLREPESPTGDE
ncbi:hypothetical protein [Thioalbus denitrificans]|uniref:hypothetical protein n=1 Tax=Thioalbus denitrificans TaxID=547122 RepID=UPI0011C03A4E|nr:hypothetical protein [Thioalbus denitrificans]